MLWIDVKYCNLISSRLPKYHVKRNNPFLAEFRCPLCGDSEKNSNKRRGYILVKDNHLVFHCFNCGAHHQFSYFLKLLDSELHREYALEVFKDEPTKKAYYDNNPNNDFKKPAFISGTQLRTIKKISSLPANHPAKVYVVNRKIPNPYHARLFYCPNFFNWVNSIIPEKFNIQGKDQERLIIPFLSKELKLFGFQGRAFDPKIEPKYYTIMLDSEMPKVFGLDTIDFSKKSYIMEGPIDSMFIPNSIAMVGADFTFGRGLDINKDLAVFVFDNEPRNKEMLKRVERVIGDGYKVCIWPIGLKYKDINEMIMAGLKPQEIIDLNTYQGLAASLALAEWRKA